MGSAFPLLILFCQLFPASQTSPLVVTLSNFFWNIVTGGDDLAGLFHSHRSAIPIAQFVGAVFFKNCPDAIKQMGGTHTNGLRVMLAMVHDLVVIDRGDLRIPLPGSLGTQKRNFLDQVRTGLRDG